MTPVYEKNLQPCDPKAFAADLKAMHRDIFHGLDNSLISSFTWEEPMPGCSKCRLGITDEALMSPED